MCFYVEVYVCGMFKLVTLKAGENNRNLKFVNKILRKNVKFVEYFCDEKRYDEH